MWERVIYLIVQVCRTHCWTNDTAERMVKNISSSKRCLTGAKITELLAKALTEATTTDATETTTGTEKMTGTPTTNGTRATTR